MAEYTMKPIDSKLISGLKTALENYKSQLTLSNQFTDLSKCHQELSKIFFTVVDARSKAISELFPTFDKCHIGYPPEYTITIFLDKELEDLIAETWQILSEKNNSSK